MKITIELVKVIAQVKSTIVKILKTTKSNQTKVQKLCHKLSK